MSQRSTPKLLVLPQKRSSEATICTLLHPRKAEQSRYLVDPQTGIYDFICVPTQDNAPRSWLIESKHTCEDRHEAARSSSSQSVRSSGPQNRKSKSGSTIISKPQLLVATSIDPLFLLLPAFDCETTATNAARNLFVSADDIYDQIIARSSGFESIIKSDSLRTKFQARLKAICDTVEAGDDSMYRLSMSKLLDELVKKARFTAASKLPESLEARFVHRALDLPVTKTFDQDDMKVEDTPSQSNVSQTESASSEQSNGSVEGVASLHSGISATTELTLPSEGEPEPGDNVFDLLRIRKVLDFMLVSYVPLSIAAQLYATLGSPESPINFSPLDQQLERVAQIRAETLAARSAGDFSRKRNVYEEDEAAEIRAEKRRKKEEEEKRKNLESRATRDLKKVDTTGMKKMSEFFTRRSPRKK